MCEVCPKCGYAINKPKNTKFFCFRQDISGGFYIESDTIAKYMIVEAFDASHANSRAKEIGIYFNGVGIGEDCSCCGDRWSEVYNSYGKEDMCVGCHPLIDSYKPLPTTSEDQPAVIIYYLSGKIEKWTRK